MREMYTLFAICWLSASALAPMTPPVANAGLDVTICPGDLIKLNGSGTDAEGGPLSFSWMLVSSPFGSTPSLFPANVPTPFFRSNVPGNYVLSLSVSDGQFSDSDSVIISILNDLPPTAIAMANVTKGHVPFNVQFDGNMSFDEQGPELCGELIASFTWSFGDGMSSIAPAPLHEYATPGTYNVTLRVKDSGGLTDTVSLTIVAELPAVPLRLDIESLSLAVGDQLIFSLDLDYARAGWIYWIFGSATGTSPGIDLGGGLLLPLNYDAYTQFTLNHPFTGNNTNFFGALDSDGHATATLTIPAGLDPVFAGVILSYAYLAGPVLGDVQLASNAQSILFLP